MSFSAIHTKIPSFHYSIFAGKSASINDFPYQAALYKRRRFICGACIIHEKYLLTAAHCIGDDLNPSRYEVRAGASSVRDANTYKLSGLQVHPLYDMYYGNKRSYRNDLAILKLKGAFGFGDTIKPIRLADSYAALQQGQMLNVSGWGRTEHSPNSKQLLYNTVQYFDLESCRDTYETEDIIIDDSMICAGVEKVGGPCFGDSGGPIGSDNVLYGVVSGGAGCSNREFPGVYTSVAYLRGWINDQTGV